MKLTSLKINDLITPDAKLTFLVGAGCSIDPPSCLPAGKSMMNSIIDYTCAESEIDKIKELKELRFEQLIEIIRDRLDPELKVIDFYGLCDKPNLQHFFLAEMIKNGHFVMTTNFDFLIEYALQAGIPKEEIKVVITKEDFEKFSNPQELYSNGLKALYKIHGSTMNILKPEGQRDTRDSLIATIQAFGSNKEGENVFQLEPFKQPAFTNITNHRSLVVIGYSGSDDFDIVPTLKVLKNLKNIIWINYSKNIKIGQEEIYEIDDKIRKSLDPLDKDSKKINQILLEIWNNKNADHVFLVNVNTKNMAKELLDFEPIISSENMSMSVLDWLENNIEKPNEFEKYYIPYRIYYDFDMYKDAMRCSEEILQIAKNKRDKKWESSALNNIGSILFEQHDPTEALKYFEEALKIDKQSGDLYNKASTLTNIAEIHRIGLNYPEALKRLYEALQIRKKLGDLSGEAGIYNNIGMVYLEQEEYDVALKWFEGALKIYKTFGDLSSIATHFHNIGGFYEKIKHYPEALKRYNEALKILEQLGDMARKAVTLRKIGIINYWQSNIEEALRRTKEALKIDEQLGNLSGIVEELNALGLIYQDQKNYLKALKKYKKALKICDLSGNLSGKAQTLNNIGLVHYAQGNYEEVLSNFEKALEILIGLGLGDSPNAKTFKRNIEGFKKIMKNKSPFLEEK